MDKNELDALLKYLCDVDGSDLHLKVGSPPLVRVDGQLRRLTDRPPLRPADTSAVAEAIMHPEVAMRFHSQHEADFAYGVSGLGRFRVNAFRQRGSVGLVFRRVKHTPQSFEELNLPDAVRQLAEEQRGLVLVTGPTGSGKTTTLAAMVDYINSTRECHIITIEDPIEYLHRDKLASINQREVGFDTLSFINALRAALREDPDVILVGEMRDLETVQTALTAAETGHLVLSTLHTINATETINRIIDFFPENQQRQARISLAGSLKGTICQRLVPRADGKGRVPAVEIMIVNGRIQQCIIERERTHEIEEIIKEGDFYGMCTFDQSLADLYEDGLIDLRSAMMASSNPHDLRVMLQNRGLLSPTGQPLN
jgi:twitching motility protein PilT